MRINLYIALLLTLYFQHIEVVASSFHYTLQYHREPDGEIPGLYAPENFDHQPINWINERKSDLGYVWVRSSFGMKNMALRRNDISRIEVMAMEGDVIDLFF